MNFKVFYADRGSLSEEEFESLAGSVTKELSQAINTLGRFGLERAASGGKAKYFGSMAEGASIVATYFDTEDLLHVYLPVFQSNADLLPSVCIHELGHRHWYKNLNGSQRGMWNKKYVPASQSTVDRIQRLMKGGKYKRYMAVVDEFTNPNERLVCIHVVNALIVNKYPIELLPNLDVREHPATKEFCYGSKLYSLIPLVSAYARESDYEDYAETFRAFIEGGGNLRAIREESTRTALTELFKKVTFNA